METALVAPCRCGHRFKQNLGGLESLPALAGPILGPQRVAAHHEALAGIRITGDLHPVFLVEERHLHVTGLHQGTEGRSPPGADLVRTRRLDLRADPRLGPHPPRSPTRTPFARGEPLPQRGDLRGQRGRIRRVTGEPPHRHRTPVPVAPKAELDRQLALPALPGNARVGPRDTLAPPSTPRSGHGAPGSPLRGAASPRTARSSPKRSRSPSMAS